MPVGSGNTFRADDDHGKAAVGEWQGPWADMRWTGPDHLLIRYADKSRIFAEEPEIEGVKVDYQKITR